MPLSPPPVDERGNVLPHDHEELFPNDILVRGISEEWIVTEADGRRRLSSQAFEPSSDGSGVSVEIEKLIAELGEDPRSYCSNAALPGLIIWTVGQLRDAACQVGYMPLPGHPCHGAVWPSVTNSKARKRVLKLASWLVQLKDVEVA